MERRGRSVDDAAALALHRSGVAEEIIRFYRLRDTPGSPVEHRAILSWVFPDPGDQKITLATIVT